MSGYAIGWEDTALMRGFGDRSFKMPTPMQALRDQLISLLLRGKGELAALRRSIQKSGSLSRIRTYGHSINSRELYR